MPTCGQLAGRGRGARGGDGRVGRGMAEGERGGEGRQAGGCKVVEGGRAFNLVLGSVGVRDANWVQDNLVLEGLDLLRAGM